MINFEGPFWSSFGTLGHLGSISELPDLKNDGFAGDSFLDHFFVSNPGTLKCAQEHSRCSLSSIFTFSVSLEKGEKWTRKWSSLGSKILTILL